MIAESVARTQDGDDYLDALVVLRADTWEFAFLRLTAAIDLGPVFTLTDVIEEFTAGPLPTEMEESTEIQARKLLSANGVIAEGVAGLMEFTKAGRAIALAMRDEVDGLLDVEAEVPAGTTRQAREERRRKQGRPGAV
ncbi:MAG: hypothetical protein M0Z88_06865 [Actinomycetota bacterium]|nr:hypothetical protein [Actinomycetota bacterium]